MKEKQLNQLKKLEHFQIPFVILPIQNVLKTIVLVHLQNQYWKVKPPAALKIISKDYESGVLKMYDDTLTELKSKHPTATEVKEDS